MESRTLNNIGDWRLAGCLDVTATRKWVEFIGPHLTHYCLSLNFFNLYSYITLLFFSVHLMVNSPNLEVHPFIYLSKLTIESSYRKKEKP